MDLSQYRIGAGQYLAERAEELYRYVSGQKATLCLAPIYEKYVGELFSDEIVRELHQHLETRKPEEERPIRCLLNFAIEHNLARRVRSLDEQIANASTNADVHTLEMKLRNTEDRSLRREIYEELRNRSDAIQMLRSERLAVYESSGRQLTGKSYAVLYEELTGLSLSLLRSQVKRFLQASRDYYYSHLKRFSELSLKLKSEDIQPWDVQRLLRGSPYDHYFDESKAMSLAKRTLMGLGIDLKKMDNIVIDAEERAQKSASPHCIRANVPEKIYLVLRPQGGLVDILSLFHEVGRSLHAANVNAGASFEDKFLGDRAVPRTMGFLLQYVVLNHEWIADYLKLQCSEELRSFVHLRKLYDLRLEAVRFLAAADYLASNQPSEKDLVSRINSSIVDVLGHPADAEFSLTGFEKPLSATDFLRGWIFEAELREIIVNRFGERWYSRPGAGDFLKELWHYGQHFSVEELASRVRLVELNLGPITRELA